MAVKGWGNKLRYEDETEREKARQFRAIISDYEHHIQVYGFMSFLDAFEVDQYFLEEHFFIKAYRKNKDLDVNLYTEKLLKKIGVSQMHDFIVKEFKLDYRKKKASKGQN